jgi:outer membrane protein assembly factor BamB
MVLFGSQDSKLYALDAKTGKLNWKHGIADQIRCFPTIVGDRLFLAGCDGKLHIIDIEKHQQVDAVDIEAPTGATAAVAGQRAYFGTSGASFFCIDWKEAKVVWTKSLPGLEFCTSAALTPEAVIIGCRDKQVRWLNTTTGEVAGSFRTRAKVESSPVVVGDRVFFGSYDGRLFAVDRKTYQKLWEFEGGSHFTASPVVAEGCLVIGNSEGTLYCFGKKR